MTINDMALAAPKENTNMRKIMTEAEKKKWSERMLAARNSARAYRESERKFAIRKFAAECARRGEYPSPRA